MARKMLFHRQQKRKIGHAVMLNVTEFPVDRLSDRELRIREWECVMSGGYGTNEHKRLQGEIWRRSSNMYSPSAPITTH